MNVKIYTDGACTGNPGPGGWAAVILLENVRKEMNLNLNCDCKYAVHFKCYNKWWKWSYN